MNRLEVLLGKRKEEQKPDLYRLNLITHLSKHHSSIFDHVVDASNLFGFFVSFGNNMFHLIEGSRQSIVSYLSLFDKDASARVLYFQGDIIPQLFSRVFYTCSRSSSNYNDSDLCDVVLNIHELFKNIKDKSQLKALLDQESFDPSIFSCFSNSNEFMTPKEWLSLFDSLPPCILAMDQHFVWPLPKPIF